MKILITGGAAGLGRAITTELAKDPSNIIYFTFNSSRESAIQIENDFPNTKSFHVDFTLASSLEDFLATLQTLEADILINNAVTGFVQDYFHKIDSHVFESSFKFNVFPTIQITQKFIELRRKKKSGKIITILTSAIINKPPLGWSEYVANKAYLHSLCKSWAIENASFGITSNSISPSFMETNLTKEIDRRLIEAMVTGNPNKRLLKEEEVAHTVQFLINSTAQINGLNVIMNAANDLI